MFDFSFLVICNMWNLICFSFLPLWSVFIVTPPGCSLPGELCGFCPVVFDCTAPHIRSVSLTRCAPIDGDTGICQVPFSPRLCCCAIGWAPPSCCIWPGTRAVGEFFLLLFFASFGRCVSAASRPTHAQQPSVGPEDGMLFWAASSGGGAYLGVHRDPTHLVDATPLTGQPISEQIQIIHS